MTVIFERPSGSLHSGRWRQATKQKLELNVTTKLQCSGVRDIYEMHIAYSQKKGTSSQKMMSLNDQYESSKEEKGGDNTEGKKKFERKPEMRVLMSPRKLE